MKLFKKLKDYLKKNLNFSSYERSLYRCEGVTPNNILRRVYITANSEEEARLIAYQNYPEVLSWDVIKEND